MARRSSDDYIPTYAERINEIEERRKYMREHKDPRGKYTIKYILHGNEYSEDIWARTQTEAIEMLKKGWSMNGIYVDVVSATQTEKSEADKAAEAAKENADDGEGVQS